MRVLTVRQPWAWAIIHGGKDVENRSRNIAGSYRGPVAIHAGLSWSDEGADDWEVRRAFVSHRLGWRADDSEVWAANLPEVADEEFAFGAVLGCVDLVDVHTSRLATTANFLNQAVCFKNGPPFGQTCSPWAMTGFEHLELAEPAAFVEPIPAKGRLGLWRPDDELLAQLQTDNPQAPQIGPDEARAIRTALAGLGRTEGLG